MECAHVREQLHRSLDGLPTESGLREHLAGCADCRVLLTEMRRTTRVLAGMKPVAAPPNLLSGIMAQLQELPPSRPAWSRWQRAATVIASVAAVVGTMLLGGSFAAGNLALAQDVAAPGVDEQGFAPLEATYNTYNTEEVPPPWATSDPVGFAQKLPDALERAGAVLLGLCFLFISGIATLLRLLPAPDFRRPAPGPAHAP